MRVWLYRLRFIIAGVRLLREYNWPVVDAWAAMADEFDSDDFSRHEGYTPAESAAEALSYWSW